MEEREKLAGQVEDLAAFFSDLSPGDRDICLRAAAELRGIAATAAPITCAPMKPGYWGVQDFTTAKWMIGTWAVLMLLSCVIFMSGLLLAS